MSFNYAQTSFTGGEWSPRLYGQFTNKKYFTAAETLTNLLIQTHGPITRRPGTRFIAEAGDSTKQVRLIPFEFSSEQAYMLEFGECYIRFYKDQGQILDGLLPYEISTTYVGNELTNLEFIQSADVLFICHPDHPPRKLTRTGHTKWTLTDIDFVDGPYLAENITATTIAPSATTGSVILTAVPGPGPEKVINGNFSPYLGAELVGNGSFGGGSIPPWVLGAGWGVVQTGFTGVYGCLHTGPDVETFSQSITITDANVYKVVFTIFLRSAGDVTVKVGGTSGTTRSVNGTYTEYLTSISTAGIFFTPSADFDGRITDISVKRMTPESNWIWGTNWVHDITNEQADHTIGSILPLEQDIGVTAGKLYTVVFTVSNRTTGTITPYLGGNALTIRSTNNTFTEDAATIGTGNLKFVPSTDFDGSVDTVSVKESATSVVVFMPGHVGSLWWLKHSTTLGYAKVTGFISKTQVNALVKKDFGGTGAVTAWREGAWSDYRGYPRTLVFHEERLFFAGNDNQPQTIWGSVTGDFENFTPEATITDAGPLTYTLASNQVNGIRWLVSSRVLLAGTMSGEWKISASSLNAPLTPTDISVRQDTNYGSALVTPRAMGNAVLFVQRQGRKVRELFYVYADDSYVAPDMSLISEHITYPGITEVAYQREPDQTLWCIRSDGVLLSMVYERPQEVVGWSKHTTDGLWESVAIIPGITQDEIWLLCNRTIGGVTKRYIELMQPVSWGADQEDCFFVDCGLTYDPVIPAAVTTISDLGHLEGKSVAILADGAAKVEQIVVAGKIYLTTPAFVVQVGLPYTPQFKNLPPEIEGQTGSTQGIMKRTNKITLRLRDTLGLQIGKDIDNLIDLPFRTVADIMDSPPPLFTGDYQVAYPGGYEKECQFIIQQNKPLPFTLQALMIELAT